MRRQLQIRAMLEDPQFVKKHIVTERAKVFAKLVSSPLPASKAALFILGLAIVFDTTTFHTMYHAADDSMPSSLAWALATLTALLFDYCGAVLGSLIRDRKNGLLSKREMAVYGRNLITLLSLVLVLSIPIRAISGVAVGSVTANAITKRESAILGKIFSLTYAFFCSILPVLSSFASGVSTTIEEVETARLHVYLAYRDLLLDLRRLIKEALAEIGDPIAFVTRLREADIVYTDSLIESTRAEVDRAAFEALYRFAEIQSSPQDISTIEVICDWLDQGGLDCALDRGRANLSVAAGQQNPLLMPGETPRNASKPFVNNEVKEAPDEENQ